jgi:TetR/AcrR family transcriptional repressor of nem operon
MCYSLRVGRPKNTNREQIVVSATELIATRGYSALSIDELVRASGATRGFIYSTFGSKLGLFQACYEQARQGKDLRHLDLLVVALREASSLSPGFAEIVQQDLDELGDQAAETVGRHLIGRFGEINGKA